LYVADQPSPTSQHQPAEVLSNDPNLKKPNKFSMASLRINGKTKTAAIPIPTPQTPAATTTTTTTTATTMATSPILLGRLRIPNPDPETMTTSSRKPSAASTPIVIRRSNPGMIGKAKLNTIKITMTLVGVFLACWTPYYVLCIW
jgi:hypothetical protein